MTPDGATVCGLAAAPPVEAAANVNKLVWIFNDQFSCRQTVLGNCSNTRTVNFGENPISKEQLRRHLLMLETQKPEIVYIRVSGHALGSANKLDLRRLHALSQIALAQRNARRDVIIEANEANEVWKMQEMIAMTEGLHLSRHRWCNYGIKDEADRPVKSVIKFACSVPLNPSYECHCGKEWQKHAKGALNGTQYINAMCHLVEAIIVPAFKLQPNEQGQEKGGQGANRTRPKSNSIQSKTHSSLSPLIPSQPLPADATNNSVDNEVVDPHFRGKKTALLVEQLSSGALQAKQVTFDDNAAQHYPTEQALRQKAAKAAVKASGQEHVGNKKRFVVEKHWDDCGSDLSGIHIREADLPSDDHYVGHLETN